MNENYSCCLTTAMKIHRPLVEASCEVTVQQMLLADTLYVVYWSYAGFGHKNFTVKLQVLLNIVTHDFSLEITVLGI